MRNIETKATGRLVEIRAGCRKWKSFAEANAHYASVISGDAPCSPWPSRLNHCSDHYWIIRATEALAILGHLHDAVCTNANKLRAKKRKAKK